jgi:D-xylose transport system substrate-binding protein
MRRAKTWLPALPALALAALTLGACVSPQQNQGGGGAGGGTGGTAAGGGYQRKTKKPGETVRIGFSMDTLKEERWQRDKQLVEARAREVGAEINVQVANSDDAVQTKQCDNLLSLGMDVLIVAPHNGEIAASIVEAAHRQGVPVISYDRLIRNADVDLYVSHQVERMGEMQAQYALERAPKGNYVLVGGAPTDNNAMLMRKGQMNILQPAVDRGDIQIVSNLFAKDWRADEALRITEDAITKTNGNIKAVVASNDGTAGGAISALEAARLVGKVIVTGQDAQLDAVQRIAAGTQSMTIYKPIKPLADSAVDNALKLARGEQLSAPDRISNGKIDVPSILHTPTAVDKNNLAETVIRDGYHKLEDVYKDVPRDQWPKVAGAPPPSTGGTFAAAVALLLGGLGLALRLR